VPSAPNHSHVTHSWRKRVGGRSQASVVHRDAQEHATQSSCMQGGSKHLQLCRKDNGDLAGSLPSCFSLQDTVKPVWMTWSAMAHGRRRAMDPLTASQWATTRMSAPSASSAISCACTPKLSCHKAPLRCLGSHAQACLLTAAFALYIPQGLEEENVQQFPYLECSGVAYPGMQQILGILAKMGLSLLHPVSIPCEDVGPALS
jgi:hypothetical protein